MDSKPAATIDPMKTSHLSNPFNKNAFLETLDLPVIAELNLIGKELLGASKVAFLPKPLLTGRTQ